VRRGELLHVDTLDLYQARQRSVFALAAARELGCKEEVIRKELGALLLKLEELVGERLAAAAAPETAPPMSDEERSAALALLGSPDLLRRILEDFGRCGVVGEETNKLVGYLAAVSRKLERPLAVIVQSASAAGKTSLMDAVLAFVPEEERIQYSALTGQSLFYMEGMNLRHKVLAVAEEEGAEKASYALKLLQSEGELRIASTGKDPQSGRLVTHEYRVEGPVMIFLTTTAVEVDEELLNRSLVLTVDETAEQTRAIHRIQRERRTLEGLLARTERDEVLRLHRNAQRLLRPLAVVNPYAPHLTFLDSRTRTRRDHEKYLTLIDAIALLHQHQREVKRIEKGGRAVEYIEATPQDIEQANRLADAVLGRSLDELPPQTRAFLEALHTWVRAQPPPEAEKGEPQPLRFTAREVREALGTGATQTKVHLARLLELEYLLAFRTAHGQLVYELLYAGEGADGRAFLVGLLDVERLQGMCDAQRSAPENERPVLEARRSGSGRPLAGGQSGGGRGAQNDRNHHRNHDLAERTPPEAETALLAASLPARRTVPANGRVHLNGSGSAAAGGAS
jgi:DNA primase